MTNPQTDITIIILAHREGLLAAPSIKSAMTAAQHAKQYGLTVEALAILDRSDQITRDVFDHLAPGFRKITVDHGDPGLSRNAGVASAGSNWIAFLDADDLWAEEWLTNAHSAAKNDQRLIVWHPEYSIHFGASEDCFIHIDMEDPKFSIATLSVSNYWTSLIFAPCKLLAAVEYLETLADKKLGFEDWSWNMRAIAAGAIHKIVPGTGHMVRVKEGDASVTRRTAALGCLPHTTTMFADRLAV